MHIASRTARRQTKERWCVLAIGLLLCVVVWGGVLPSHMILGGGVAWAAPDSEPGDNTDADKSGELAGSKKDPSGKQAKKYFRQGQRMFAMGRFRQALTSYEKAYALSEYPDILFNIAQCYRNLGDYESAIFHFRAYLDKKPDAGNRDAVLALISKLESEMATADQNPPDTGHKPKNIKPPPDKDKDRDKVVESPRPAERRSRGGPFYKRWWFWTGVVVVAAGAGTGAYFFFLRDRGVPDTSLGNIDFP